MSPAVRLFITISACALLSQGHHDFSLRSSSKSVIILHSRLHLCTTPGIELYECSSWGRGADFSFSSCGCPAGSALFAGESIFGLLPRRVPFLGSAASVCGGLLTGSPPCSALHLPPWAGAPLFLAGALTPSRLSCWPHCLFLKCILAVFAFWLPCDVQSQLTNFNKNACRDCDSKNMTYR